MQDRTRHILEKPCSAVYFRYLGIPEKNNQPGSLI